MARYGRPAAVSVCGHADAVPDRRSWRVRARNRVSREGGNARDVQLVRTQCCKESRNPAPELTAARRGRLRQYRSDIRGTRRR